MWSKDALTLGRGRISFRAMVASSTRTQLARALVITQDLRQKHVWLFVRVSFTYLFFPLADRGTLWNGNASAQNGGCGMVWDGATDVVVAAPCVKGGAGLLGSISSVVREGCVCVSMCVLLSLCGTLAHTHTHSCHTHVAPNHPGLIYTLHPERRPLKKKNRALLSCKLC